MKNMFNVIIVLPHNLLQTNPCIRHNFSTQVFRKRAGQLHYVGPALLVPNEEHVQCDHRFASQPLANEPLHSSQLFDTSLQKARGTTSLCGPSAAQHFLAFSGLQRRPEKARNARVCLQEVVRQNGGHIEHVLHWEQFSSL